MVRSNAVKALAASAFHAFLESVKGFDGGGKNNGK